MLNYIKELFFKKDKKEKDTYADDMFDGIEVMEEDIDYSEYPDPIIIDSKQDKNILFLDDINNVWLLYEDDILTIKNIYGKDIYKDFNIIKCLNTTAGFTAHKFISTSNIKIDYAIIDITLGYGVKLNDGRYIEYDGIDVLLSLLKKNKDLKFIFSTAHSLNRKNATINYYFNKFEHATKLKFEDYYMNKNDERYKTIYKLLYKD